MGFDLLADLDLARHGLTEPKESYADFASRMIIPDGDMKGQPFDPGRHPAQREVVWALDAGFRRIVIPKPIQDGGSTVLMMPLIKRAVSMHQDVILAYPTLDSAKDIWTMKVWPILAAFGGQEPKSGGGSRGGAARVVTLPGGGRFILRQAGGRNESAQASITGDAIQVEEVDDWPSIHRIELIGGRISRAPDPLQVYVSTVKKDRDSLILQLYAEPTCTQSHLEYPCPHCGTVQRLEWGRVDIDHAVYVCMKCSKAWSEPQRLRTLRDAQRIDQRPSAPAFSLLWTGLESPFPILVDGRRMPVLPGLCAKYQRALAHIETGEHGPMRSFHRDHLTQGYNGDREELDAMEALTWQALLRRCQGPKVWAVSVHSDDRPEANANGHTYSRHIADLPESANFCASGVDVQGNRVYWSLVAFAMDGTTYDTAWGYEYARADQQPWNTQELHALLDRTSAVMHEGAGSLGMPIAGLDVGDFSGDLLPWLKGKAEWYATKGASHALKPKPGDLPGIASHNDDGHWLINIDAVREIIHSAYRRPLDAIGACHIPRLQNVASDTAYLKHLCAERMITDPKTRKQRLVKGPGRWDWQDARRIAEVMGRLWLKKLAQPPRPRRKYGTVGTVNLPDFR